MVKGWIPISISEQLGQRLIALYSNDRKRPENQKFSPWVNNILLKYVEFQICNQKESGVENLMILCITDLPSDITVGIVKI